MRSARRCDARESRRIVLPTRSTARVDRAAARRYVEPVPLGRRLARGLLLVALAVAVFWTLGEIVTRTFDLVDRLNGFPRKLFTATDEPDLGYRLRPGVDTEARGVHVVTNALGLRGPEVARVPAPGTNRVLVLGDSVAFGFRLEQGETFSVLLEHELEQRDGGSWEVLNGGVEGYNTVNELAYLRSSLLDLEPRTIVLVFNLNDFDYGPVMGPLGVLTLDQSQRVQSDSLALRSEFLLLLRWLIATQGRVWLGQGPAATATPAPGDTSPFNPFDRFVSALRKRYYAQPDDERWQRMVDALHDMAAICRARGIRLVVAIVPDGDQVGVASPDLTPQKKLADVCRALALDCIDLQPSFAADPHPLLYLDIMHPNADGQRIMARDVARHLLAAQH
jgi:lysophospholipase L1-like esterase